MSRRRRHLPSPYCMVHVDDLVEAAWLAYTGGATGCRCEPGDVLRRIPGCRIPFNSEVCQRLTGSACYQAGKLRKELEWRPRRRFYEALPDMVAAYRHASLLTLP